MTARTSRPRFLSPSLFLPGGLYDGQPEAVDLDDDDAPFANGDRSGDLHVREGSYFVDNARGLMQVVDGQSVAVKVRKGRSSEGIPEKHVRSVSKLIPVRDAVREVLKAQELDRPWKDAQVRLRIAWSNFVRAFGPINTTVVSTTEDEETGEVRETHRRPNLQPFLDDPDCWLVASIEDYDLESDTATPGPIFTERVIAPPAQPSSPVPPMRLLSCSTSGAMSMPPISRSFCIVMSTTSLPNSAAPSFAIPPTVHGRRPMPICRALSATS